MSPSPRKLFSFLVLMAGCGTPATAPVDAGSCPAGQVSCGGQCTNPLIDPRNCGSCGTPCTGDQVCVSGKCGVPCPRGQVPCASGADTLCVSPMIDANNCGGCGHACGAGQGCSAGVCSCPPATPDSCGGDGGDGACTRLSTDPANCGRCGNACAAGLLCDGGTCKGGCSPGLAACPPMMPTYCANLMSDGANCGACGMGCPVGQQCAAGMCACPMATPTPCGMGPNAFCTNAQTDPQNCGGCGTLCPEGQQCVAGKCACPLLTPDACGMGMNAFCTSKQADPQNCGACGTVCPPGQQCVAGACACPPAKPNGCGMGMGAFCTDQAVDPANCGACGKVCPAGQSCQGGLCVCPPAKPDACGVGGNAFCTDVKTDAANCGACGSQCAGGQVCQGGKCTSQCSQGLSACPVMNPKYCADLASDANNCGACGSACPLGQQCGAGKCACPMVTPDACGMGMSAFCTNRKVDSANCGMCGTACLANQSCVSGVCVAPKQTMTLLAGTFGSFGNLDGTGTNARFQNPVGVAFDGSGSVYVADSSNAVIRKVALANGATTVLAGGLNLAGFSDGAAAAARFNNPLGLACDGKLLYVADTGNNAIRQIVLATGVVSTLAGGVSGYLDAVGMAAKFSSPQDLALDGAGNLFIADVSNQVIRGLSLMTSAVTTLAGTAGAAGSADGVGAVARFSGPRGIASDGAGNLFVADTTNSTIRQIVINTATVTTLVGLAGAPGVVSGIGSAARFRNPVGIVSDLNVTLFVADTGNGVVRQVNVSNATATPLAGSPGNAGFADGSAGAALFNAPSRLALDGKGNVLCGDQNNHAIRSVAIANGAVTTLAGLGAQFGASDGMGASARVNLPGGIDTDGKDTLYFADTGNHTIRKITVSKQTTTTLSGIVNTTGNVDGPSNLARFNSPNGVAWDGMANLYVADTNNHTIRKVKVADGSVTTVAGVPGNLGGADGPAANATFSSPQGVAFDPAGVVYVADTNGRTVRRIDLGSGAVTTLAGTFNVSAVTDGVGANARFGTPIGIAFDGVDTLYVSDSNRIRALGVKAGSVTTLTGGGGYSDGKGFFANFNGPRQITLDGAGSLFVADFNNNVIRKMATGSSSVTTVGGEFGRIGLIAGPLPTSIFQPRSVVPLGVGFAFTANAGVFLVQ